MRRLFLCIALISSLSLAAAQKTVSWTLSDDWEETVSYGTVEGFVDISGGSLLRRYGYGRIGEPDLPMLVFRVAVPVGGSFVGVAADATWTDVVADGRLPVPIAEPVPFGAKLAYPQPDAGAYGGVYPKAVATSGDAEISAGVTMVPVRVTPYRWDGAAKTLKKAASLKVTVTLDAPQRPRLALSVSARSNPRSAKSRALAMTINPSDADNATATRVRSLQTSQTSQTSPLGQILIVSPSAFVDLWKAYAAFRKSTEAGRDFEYVVKDTAEIYADLTLNTVEGDDALAIHHWIESAYKPDREQYVILGAAPKKYAYDRATMIPARYVVNQGALDQVCDMYYGCMDRKKGGKTDSSVEVWDYDLDGTYMGHKNSGGGYSSDSNDNVDWTMELPVSRVPLMREVVETSGGQVYRLTAAEIMDHFTNKIAFVESETRFDPPKRWRHVLGGGYLFNSYNRGSTDYLVEGERAFFDGGYNMFDARHASPAPDAEACPRDRNFITYSKARAARHGLINTGGLKTTEWGELYKAWGEIFDVHCHGWARGADPGTTGGALFATGLFRIYNMALPCESGMYDYCPNGSYGITNCVSMGEAPLLCFNRLGGGAVTFNNTRYGWWGGYNGMSGRMEGLINGAFYGQVGDGPMNAGEVCVYMHNNCGLQSCGNRGGASNLEVVMHGDPLIRISPQYARTWNAASTVWTTNAAAVATWTIPGKDGAHPMDYTTDLTVDATGRGAETFEVRDDLAAARFTLTGDEGETVTLDGEGTFRVTDRFTVNGTDLEWRVAGGAGRNGIAFAGRRGNVTLSGNAKRYFGSSFVNVNELKVTGGNVTLDTPKNATAAANFDIMRLSFVSPGLDETENDNVLRSRAPGVIPAFLTVAVVSNRLALATRDIGGSDATLKDTPLFYVTNGFLKVVYNPHWGTEYFVRPTHLHDGHIVGDYEKFGFGRTGSNGYDLYVTGRSSIEGETPILLNGELRVHVAPGAELEIANPMADGADGTAGSLRVTGGGKVRVTGAQTFTGGIVVEDSSTLELGLARAVRCDVSVASGATLDLGELPLEGVKTVTLANNASLVLAGPTGAGLYQIADPATATVVLDAEASVFDRANPETPLVGTMANGYFILSANRIFWSGASGTWKNDTALTANWRTTGGAATGFADTMPVVFTSQTSVAEAAVTVVGTVKPGYASFENTASRYAFAGAADACIELASLVVSHDVTFGVGLSVGNVLKVTDGTVTATNVESSLIEVTGGRFHASGDLTVPEKGVKALKFSFTAAKDTGNITAVQELRLFDESGWFALPVGTVIEDNAGQRIRITGSLASSMAHGYEWEAGKPSNVEESLKALVDGTVGGNNKWWSSKNAAPAWFTIEFPSAQTGLVGYNLCTADHAPRNPRTWSVTASRDGTSFAPASSVDVGAYASTRHWMANDGTASGWTLDAADGLLHVKDGGALAADGRIAMDLAFDAGAKLVVVGSARLEKAAALATLTLPDAAETVTVDASEATVTGTAFPILVGYGLTSEDFHKFRCLSDTAVLNLKNGDLYIVTDGIVQAPYTADVKDNEIVGGKLTWSQLAWKDRNNAVFTWNDAVNYQSGGAATINLDWLQAGAVTLEIDVAGALGSLTVQSAKAKDPVTLAWKQAFVPRTLDFTGYAGSVTLDYGPDNAHALGYSDFKAGATLAIPAAGSGALTIAAGRRAVVPDWNDWSKVSGSGTIALDTAGDVAAGWANANGVSGTNQVVRGKWEIKNTADYPKNKEVLLTGADARLKLSSVVDTTGYGNYTTGLTVEDGAVFEVAKRDTFNRALTLRNGGEVRLAADATDSNRALDLYERASLFVEGTGNVIGGSAATADAETGDPTVNTGIVALRDSSGFILNTATGATLDVYSQWGGAAALWYAWTKTGAGMVSFYRASAQTGDLNVRAGTVRLVNKGQGTTGGIVNQAELQLVANGAYVQTVDNAISGVGRLVKLGAGTSVLKGANTYSGETAVREGTLRIGNAKALGSTSGIALESGALDLGLFRFPEKTVTVSAGAKIRVDLTQEESAGQVRLVKLALPQGTAAKDVFAFFVNGVELPAKSYNLEASDSGVIEFRPSAFSGYEFPLETQALGAHDWTEFAWLDQQGAHFQSNWCDYAAIDAAVSVQQGTEATMTLETEDVRLSQLTVRNEGSLVISNGTKSLTAKAIDMTGSTGVSRFDFALGEATLTADGRLTLTRPGTGAMKILDGAEVTLEDASERGTVALGEDSVLRYAGRETLTTLPWMTTDNRTGGWIAYAKPVTLASGEAVFGGEGDSAVATCGRFELGEGFSMSVARLVTGNGAGSVQRFRQTGGTLAVTEEPLRVGKDASVDWTTSGGTLRTIGLADGTVASTSFTLAGGTLELGEDGIVLSDKSDLTFAGGTLKATANTRIEAAKGLVVTGDTVFEAPAGVTLTVVSPVRGTGCITCRGDGTVLFLGDCKNATLAGKLTIQLQPYQQSNTSTSSYLFNMPAGAANPSVTILGTNGQSATGGGGVRSNDGLKYHWRPTGKYVQPISATLAGGQVYLYNVTWTDAVGTKLKFSELSGDIEIVMNVAGNSDTTIPNLDVRKFAKLRINGPRKLTVDNTQGAIMQMSLVVEEADIRTDVELKGPSLRINKLTGLSEGKTLILSRSDQLGSLGDGPFCGTLNCRNFEPPWTNVFGDPNRWQGTLKLASSGKTLSGEDRFWDDYGNVNSKLELSGYYTGYLKPGGSTSMDLKLNGYLRFQDGYSVNGGYTFAGPLTGTGGIYAEKSPSGRSVLDVIRFTGDASGFAGEVEVAGGHCIAFGEQEDDDSGFNKIIVRKDVVIANGKKWLAEAGIDVMSGGRLTILPHTGGDLATSSEVTVLEDGTLDLIVSGSPKSIPVTSDKLSIFGTLCVNGVEVTDYEIEGGTVRLGGDDPEPFIVGAKWGNVGTAEKGGVASDYNRGNYTCAWTVDFGATQNICTAEIGTNGLLVLSEIRIAGRDSNDINHPGALTVSQNGKSVASAKCEFKAGALPVYRPSGQVIQTYPVNVFTFTNRTTFSTAEPLTLRFDTATTGVGVIKPKNPKLCSGDWSPIIEITGDYGIVQPHSVSINVIGGNSNRPGKRIASGAAGAHPVAVEGWNQLAERSNNSSFTLVKDGLLESFADGTVEAGPVSATLSGACAYTAGVNASNADAELAFGYIDDGGTGARIVVDNIPYTEYDVYVYMGTDVGDKTAGAFGPVAVSSGGFATNYPSAGVAWGSANATHGTVTLAEGQNYFKVSGLAGRQLVVNGSSGDARAGGRCGIAGIQIVNTGLRLASAPYSANITRASVAWDDGDGEGLADHGEWDNSGLNAITLTNGVGEATLDFNTSVNAAKLAVVQNAGQTLKLTASAALKLGGYDTSRNGGTLVLGYPLGESLNVASSPFAMPSSATLGFDLGTGASQEVAGTTTDADRSYALLVTSGTLAFSTTSGAATPFRGRVVTARGADAAIRLGIGDATGYSTGAKKIVLAEGGRLLVARRDTLKSPLELRSGSVVLEKGCASGYRGLDLYGNNDWNVTADSTLVAADGASADDRKVMLRNGDWNVTVGVGATFDVAASVVGKGSTGAGGTPGKLVKKGSGVLILRAANTFGTGTVIEDGMVTVASDAALGTGPVTLKAAGTINVLSDVVTNAYAISKGKITLEGDASAYNITVNGEPLVGVWKFNDTTNGIERVLEAKDYPDGEDTPWTARLVIDDAVENGLVDSQGKVIAPANEVAAAVKAASAGSSTPEQKRITDSMMLGSEELVSEDAALATVIEIAADGSLEVTVSGKSCTLKEGPIVLGYLVLWTTETLGGEWTPSAIEEITTDNAATVTLPKDGAASKFFRSSFEWKRPQGL